MEGYYNPAEYENGSQPPRGRLRIEVKNLPEFYGLMEQAKKEADQLQKTINRLSNFELFFDFVSDPTDGEP